MNSEKLFNRNFTLITLGQLISIFGNMLQRFSLSLYILDLTGSATIFATILSLTLLPQIFLAPFGGAIADRCNKKTIMVLLDFFSSILLILFALLLHIASSQIFLIGILLCLLAIIQSIYDPSVRASIPAIVAEQNLTSANSVVSQISAISNLAAPVAAGFLYGTFGIEMIFLLNILSFLLSAVIELFLSFPYVKQEIEGSALTAFAGDIRESFSFLIYQKRILFYMLLVSCSFNLFLSPIYSIGVPYIEKVVFGVSNQLYGISEGFVGLGMITGALLVNVLSRKLTVTKLHCYFLFLVILILGMGATTLPFIMEENAISYLSYSIFTFIGFLFSVCLAVINVLCITFVQIETPIAMMGKIMALVTSLSLALMPVGQILFGTLYEIFSGSEMIIYLIVAVIIGSGTFLIYRLTFSEAFHSTETAKKLVHGNDE